MRKLYVSIILTLLLYSCNSSITFSPIGMFVKTTQMTVTEGEKAVISFSLDGKISQEFLMKAVFSSNEFKLDYANPNDFSPYLEYSLDNGKSWNTEGDGSHVKVAPSNNSTYMVRFSTTDDTKPEISSEKLSLTLKLASTDRQYLKSELPKITVAIQDNDTSRLYRDNLYIFNYLMGFEKSNDGNFSLKGVTYNVTTKKEKEIIDGNYVDILNMINRVIKISPKFSNITRINFDYNPLSPKLASVETFIDGRTEAFKFWTMYINLSRPYINLSTGKSQKFNQDGGFGSTLIHELGHILTLSNNQQTLQSEASCTSNSMRIEKNRCFFQDSYMSKFVNNYYDAIEFKNPSPKTNLKQPSFVSQYSSTNFFEDIAESFAGYVHNSNTPPYEGNGAYLQKIGFFEQYSTLKDIKYSIRNLGYLISSPGKGYSTSNGGFSHHIFQNCVHDKRLSEFEERIRNTE